MLLNSFSVSASVFLNPRPWKKDNNPEPSSAGGIFLLKWSLSSPLWLHGVRDCCRVNDTVQVNVYFCHMFIKEEWILQSDLLRQRAYDVS